MARHDCSNRICPRNNRKNRCLLRQCKNIAQCGACKIGGQGKRGVKLRDLKEYGKGTCGWIEKWQLG